MINSSGVLLFPKNIVNLKHQIDACIFILNLFIYIYT